MQRLVIPPPFRVIFGPVHARGKKMFDNPTSYYTGRNDAGRTTLHPRDYHRKPAIDTGMRGGGRAWNRSRRQELGMYWEEVQRSQSHARA